MRQQVAKLWLRGLCVTCTSCWEDRDLAGPTAHLQPQAVAGHEQLTLRAEDFVKELRLTPFAADKVVAVRD